MKNLPLQVFTVDIALSQIENYFHCTTYNMVKRIARYGFKSGILPKPRQIVEPFKTKAEIAQEEKENVGFADKDLIPKGVPQIVPLKARISAQHLIDYSAKKPSEETIKKRAEWRNRNADVRREFLTRSLLNQETAEQQIMKRREAKAAREKQLQTERMELMKSSQATTLTLPTIESFLTTQPFVVPRTKEEIELLKAKKEANRVKTDLEQKTEKAKGILEIYQSASSYIVDVDELEQAINNAFSSGNTSFSYLNTETAQNDMTKALFGVTNNFLPGVEEVQDAVSGNTTQFKNLLEKLENQEESSH